MYTAADTKQNKCSCALCLPPWTVYINGSIRFAMTICVCVDCCLCVCIWSQYLIQSKCIESVALLVSFACPARCYRDTIRQCRERVRECRAVVENEWVCMANNFIFYYMRAIPSGFSSFFSVPYFSILFTVYNSIIFIFCSVVSTHFYLLFARQRQHNIYISRRSLATATTTTAYGYDAHNQ